MTTLSKNSNHQQDTSSLANFPLQEEKDETRLHLRLVGSDHIVIKSGKTRFAVYELSTNTLYKVDKVKEKDLNGVEYKQGHLVWGKSKCAKWEVKKIISNVAPQDIHKYGNKDDVTFLPNLFPFNKNGYNGFGNDFCIGTKLVYWEIDNISLEEQKQKLETFEEKTGLKVTVVSSGGKSLHCFIRLNEAITDFELWKRIQRKLIVIFNSDTSIRKESQVMRLAGQYRYSTGKWQNLEQYTEESYSIDHIEKELDDKYGSLFPHGLDEKQFATYQSVLKAEGWEKAVEELQKDPQLKEKKESKPKGFDNTSKRDKTNHTSKHFSLNKNVNLWNINCEELNLSDCLNLEKQDWIKNGVSQERNNTGFNLAKTLIQTEEFLQQNHFSYKGTARDLFLEFCSNCPSEDWNEKEWNEIWESAERRYHNINHIDEDAIKNRIENRNSKLYKAKLKQKQKELHQFNYKNWGDYLELTEKDLSKNDHKKYLPVEQILEKKQSYGIFAIKAPKGLGKSHLIARLISERINLGKTIVSVNPRISLNKKQEIEWDLEIKDFSGNTEKFNALCYDSLLKILNNLRLKKDFDLVLDECEQGINHLLSSSTLKEKRQQILGAFEEIVKIVDAEKNLIVMSDADLTDVSIDFIKRIVPEIPVFSVVANVKPDPWDIKFQTGSSLKKASTEKHIKQCLENNKKIAIATDRKKDGKALAEYLQKIYKDKCIQIVSKETREGDTEYDYLIDFDTALEKNQPDVLIYTPIIGTGISNDINYFHYVFGLFYGIISPSDCRQMLARIRSNVPRIIWCKKYGNLYGGHKSFFPEEIKNNLKQKPKELAVLAPYIENNFYNDDAFTPLHASDCVTDSACPRSTDRLKHTGQRGQKPASNQSQVEVLKTHIIKKVNCYILDDLSTKTLLFQEDKETIIQQICNIGKQVFTTFIGFGDPIEVTINEHGTIDRITESSGEVLKSSFQFVPV